MSRAQQLPEDGIVDPVAVRRALSGERLPLTQTERAVVAHALRDEGLTEGQIAYRLGVGIYTARRLLNRTVNERET